MRQFLFLSLISACFSPHAAEGVPCDLANPHCPEGQTCQGTGVCSSSAIGSPDGPSAQDAAIDAPRPDAGPMDRDGDGVLDDDDNCPDTYNPGQENEDGDKFGDVCDPCPPHFDNHPTDSDGDGISDDCDPNPNQPGEKIVLFEGFHHGIPDSWTKSGNWFSNNDDAVANENSNDVALLGDLDPLPAGSDEVVVIGAQMSSTNTSTDQNGIGIATTVGGDGHGATCGLVRDATMMGKPGIELWDTFDGSQLSYMDFTWATGVDFSIAISRYGTDYWCDVWNDDIDAEVKASYAMTPNPEGFSMFVHAARMRVHWLMVIKAN